MTIVDLNAILCFMPVSHAWCSMCSSALALLKVALHVGSGAPRTLLRCSGDYNCVPHVPDLPSCTSRSVRISALALLKMAMHAKSGGNLEIMGMLYGKVQGDTFIVIDAFALPVEGTETRVNAQAEAYEYMVDFAETNKVDTQPF